MKFLSHQSTKKTLLNIFVTLVGLSAGLFAYAQEEIGVAAAVNTTTTDNFYDPSGMFAERRLIEEGYKIIQNRTIETDEKGKAQMILIDGTAFTIGPNSKVILDKFVYNPETNDGFLEMQATGLLRLVGGKVTKKNAAMINTNVATVGIRGGIVIVDSDNETTSAAFVYGQEMEVIPLQNQAGRTLLTEDGFVVEVNDPYEDIDTPELLTAEALASYSADFEGDEEEEEEESESESEGESEEEEESEESEEESEEESTEEESEEESTEEESEEESTEEESTEEESTEEESTEEESTEEQPEGSEEGESSEGDESGTESSDEGSQEDSSEGEQETPATEAEETETEQPTEADTPASEENDVSLDSTEDSPVADSEPLDVSTEGDSSEVDLNDEFTEVSEQEEPEIEIDENSLLTGAGISDNSSNVAPDQLTTSDDIGGELGRDLFEIEQEEEDSVDETTDEVQDTTSETVQQEAIEEKMAANVSVRAESFVESSPKNTLIATTAVEGQGITYALENDFGVFKVNKKGKIKTKGFLDFETTQQYNLVLLVTNKRGEVTRVPFRVDVADVSELSASHTVRATSFHEGSTPVDSIVADILPVSDETPTYELTGAGSEYFRINNNGKIKVDQPLDFSAFQTIELQVVITSGTESTTETLVINVQENLPPDFTTACQSSCALAESVATGTVVINASRTDTDIDDLTYSLENNFGNKFSINQATGQVTLNSALDYETTNSYNLKIIATDSKGITKERSSNFSVTDVSPGYSGNLISDSKAESVATGTVILNSSVSNFANPTYSISGGDAKFEIDASTGQVTLANALDYETEQSHTFTVTATAGGETESQNFTLIVSDVSLGYSGTLVSSNQLETIATGTVILNSALGGSFSNPSYSISGGNGKFSIDSSTGQVTLTNPLDYETEQLHTFTVTAQAGNESQQETFEINVDNFNVPLNVIAATGQDITVGATGAQYNLGEFSPAGTVVSNANSGGMSGVTYLLLKQEPNPLVINPTTGQVTLGSALDYETASTFRYQVSALKDGESTNSGIIVYQVNNETYFPTGSANLISGHQANPNFSNPNFFTGKFLDNQQLGHNIDLMVPYDINTRSKAERKLFDLNDNLPAGTTFSCQVNAMASGNYCLYIEFDDNGDVYWEDGSNQFLYSPYSISPYYASEAQIISYLSGTSTGGTNNIDFWRKQIRALTIVPNEPQINQDFHVTPKAIELNENVVMRVASGYSNVQHDKTGANPFTATATRGTGSSVNVNGNSVYSVVTESALSTADLNSSSKILAADARAHGTPAYIVQGEGAKTYYRTNTVANGDNEGDVSILDFEYWFPVDSPSEESGEHIATGTEYSKGIYAPLAVTNADWANQAHSHEQAKYGCYESGQTCNSGTGTEPFGLTLSASMVESTESSGSATFTGYKVIQSHMSVNTDTLLNADFDGGNAGNGTASGVGAYNSIIAQGAALSGGLDGFNLGQTNDQYYSEFETVRLPESFNYFGQDFTHIYVNENGFLTFGNGEADSDKPWNDVLLDGNDRFDDNDNRPHLGGGRILHYLDDAGSYTSSSSSTPEAYRYPDLYGKPGTAYEGNLNNSIFALWADYHNDSDDASCGDGCNDFSIRKLWDATSKILTIGWYNMGGYNSNKPARGANFEVQFNFNTNEFKIVQGKIGNKFPAGGNPNNNVFIGFSKDVTCATTTADISACEGKDYVQLFFNDSFHGNIEDNDGTAAAFHNYSSNPNTINNMYNDFFNNNQTKNGTEYCFDSGTAANTFGAAASCSSTYTWNEAKGSSTVNHLTRAVPQYSSVDVKNVLLPSDINQSYQSGLGAEFMWMHLNHDAATLTYTPPENNAVGFTLGGANKYPGVDGGTLNAGSAISTTTFKDEIIIGGEVYKAETMEDFLNNTKKVIAYAPVPILHTHKYELAELASDNSAYSDPRYKRTHTFMPHFISTEFMEDKDNGTDALFDFHQLVDHDYSKSGAHLRYDTIGNGGNNNFANANLNHEHEGEAVIDGMYAYAADILDHTTHVSSLKHTSGGAGSAYDLVPEGQSLWQQIFNSAGRGPGLFVQMNWSCGHMGVTKCGESGTYNSVGYTAGKTNERQQSLFSVLITEVGDKTFFPAEYWEMASGTVMQGEHYWSYSRRSGRTTTTDGEYATTDATPQLTFGLNPISCISGQNNGCFFGDDQDHTSSTLGAPSTAIVTTSDPCESSHARGCSFGMDLGVMHSMEATTNSSDPHYKTGTFYQGIVQQQQRLDDTFVDAINLSGSNSWRAGQTTTDDTWTGRMTGLFMTDDDDTYRQPMYWKAEARVNFDDINDRVLVEMLDPQAHKLQDYDNNADNDWYHGEFSHVNSDYDHLSPLSSNPDLNTTEDLFFGDADKTSKPCYNTSCPGTSYVPWTKSAYLNKQVFGAMLKNQSKSINSSGTGFTTVGDNAGAIVTWEAIDNKDRDFMMDNTIEPSLEYMTWGVWGMAMSDSRAAVADAQTAAVHMGTWYAGDLLDPSDWPTEAYSATLAGMAMFDVFARLTDGSTQKNYHWTEGTGVTGQVDFAANGSYRVHITAQNLGKSIGCTVSACEHGLKPDGTRGAIGPVIWSSTNTNTNAGVSSFTGISNSLTTNNAGITIHQSQKMEGHLFGTWSKTGSVIESDIEVGASLQFSRETNTQMIMMTGTAILSE